MKTHSLAAIALAVLVASGCARREESTEDPQTSAQGDGAVRADLPPPEIATVTVQLTLAADAEARLKAAGENVQVETVFAGDPRPEAAGQVNELGLLELGKSTQELSTSGTLEFPQDLIDQSRLGLIIGQPQVIVNVHSSMKSTQSNLLNCPFYWETLKIAGQAPVQINCTLATAE